MAACKPDAVLADAIWLLVRKHGSFREAAKVLKVSAPYLNRLYNGQKTDPGDALLKRLGLVKVVTYAWRVK